MTEEAAERKPQGHQTSEAMGIETERAVGGSLDQHQPAGHQIGEPLLR